jgi:Xaa-Pro aminopeptidase
MNFFESGFFKGNQLRLLELSGAKLIVICASGVLQRSGDTTFPFRQDSNFWYLTGVDEPDFCLVLTPDEEFLIEPMRDAHRDQWDGRIDRKHLKSVSGVDKIFDAEQGWERLAVLAKKTRIVHTIKPSEGYIDVYGFYVNPARGSLFRELQDHTKAEIEDIRNELANLRQVKQEPEIKALQHAIDITSQTLEEIRSRLTSFKHEYEVEAAISYGFRKRGASGHAYSPIVAAGKNACTIHYVSNKAEVAADELLLADVGAEVSYYSADITRTFATGRSSKRQKAVHKSVKRVQDEALKLLKPGVNFKKYEQAVDAIMAKELKSLGLLEDVDDKKSLKRYYPHLTSHFLGLDTHDAADYDRPLEPGMVLTVEPGIYIPEEGIGVRIEDNVLITEDGCKNLSAGLSREL